MRTIEDERARNREKYHRLYKGVRRPYTENVKAAYLGYRLKYPEKYEAGKAIRNWNRKPGIDFHHWSYRQEHYKDTLELPKKDHAKAHRFLVYDQKQLMYRTLTGTLLDTKRKHDAYIKSKILYAK